jgi:hypothetical protein
MKNMIGKNKITKQGIEETIRRVLPFVQEVNYFEGSNLVYVRISGGISIDDLERLERIGLKLRYANPITFKNQYGTEHHGLMISLEVLS